MTYFKVNFWRFAKVYKTVIMFSQIDLHRQIRCTNGRLYVGRHVSKIQGITLTYRASIFTAELVALNLELDIIRRSSQTFSYCQTLSQVRWPFMIAVLKLDTYSNVFLTITSLLILEKPSLCAGFQVILVSEETSVLMQL